jgi:hypothetical protein
MKPTKTLHDLGQSLWLDNITRSLVNSGTLQRYVTEFSVTRAHLESDNTVRSVHHEKFAGICQHLLTLLRPVV